MIPSKLISTISLFSRGISARLRARGRRFSRLSISIALGSISNSPRSVRVTWA
jgi:hypothetical protein